MKRKLFFEEEENKIIKKPKLYEMNHIRNYIFNQYENIFNLKWRKLLNGDFESMIYVFLVEATHEKCNKIFCLKIGYTSRITENFPRYIEHSRNFHRIIPLFVYGLKNSNMYLERKIHKKMTYKSIQISPHKWVKVSLS